MSHTHSARMRWIPTHPPTVLLFMLLFEIGLSLVPGARGGVPWIAQLIGGALILVGIVLNLAAARGFERHGTPVSPSARPVSLVTRGVFGWTRNPMYLGFALVIGGAALALAAPWALAALPVYVGWIDRLIHREEARLEQAFGDVYRNYQRRVRRWL